MQYQKRQRRLRGSRKNKNRKPLVFMFKGTHKPYALPLKLHTPCSNSTLRTSLLQMCPIFPPSQPKHSSTPLPNPLFIFWSLLPPHLRSLHIRRTLIIRLGQHTHHAYQNLLHALYRRPSLRRMFVMIWVVSRRMKNRDTD